jgi:Protein of unknown function (DUF4254)
MLTENCRFIGMICQPYNGAQIHASIHMFQDLSSAAITHFHDDANARAGWHDCGHSGSTGTWHWIEINHRCNSLLWSEEDLARRLNVSDTEIAGNKRAIDGFNQRRNDAVEKIDESILSLLAQSSPASGAYLSSETAGSMVDRLSILSLKIKAMREQTLRAGASTGHISACRSKLSKLQEQRHDLAACFDALLDGAVNGTRYFKIYRQFKMYNDPTLNPQLYKTSA